MIIIIIIIYIYVYIYIYIYIYGPSGKLRTEGPYTRRYRALYRRGTYQGMIDEV